MSSYFKDTFQDISRKEWVGIAAMGGASFYASGLAGSLSALGTYFAGRRYVTNRQVTVAPSNGNTTASAAAPVLAPAASQVAQTSAPTPRAKAVTPATALKLSDAGRKKYKEMLLAQDAALSRLTIKPESFEAYLAIVESFNKIIQQANGDADFKNLIRKVGDKIGLIATGHPELYAFQILKEELSKLASLKGQVLNPDAIKYSGNICVALEKGSRTIDAVRKWLGKCGIKADSSTDKYFLGSLRQYNEMHTEIKNLINRKKVAALTPEIMDEIVSGKSIKQIPLLDAHIDRLKKMQAALLKLDLKKEYPVTKLLIQRLKETATQRAALVEEASKGFYRRFLDKLDSLLTLNIQ